MLCYGVLVLCCAVLCCAVLCCAALCSAALCCAVLCCAMLCRAVLCCIMICYDALWMADFAVQCWLNYRITANVSLLNSWTFYTAIGKSANKPSHGSNCTCRGALWVRVKGQAHIGGLLTEYKEWNMTVKQRVNRVYGGLLCIWMHKWKTKDCRWHCECLCCPLQPKKA